MGKHAWDQVPLEQMNALITRRMLHTKNTTVARLTLKKGAVVPEHRHENEQVSMILSGSLLFRFPDEEVLVSAGEVLTIESNRPHSAEAVEDCLAIDLFSPPREDWIRGDDAYLRR